MSSGKLAGQRKARHRRGKCLLADIVNKATGGDLPNVINGCQLCTETEGSSFEIDSLRFIQDDPARQKIGSFNPINDENWTKTAYFDDMELRPLEICFAILIIFSSIYGKAVNILAVLLLRVQLGRIKRKLHIRL